jgi:predicted aspartyl protease
MQATPSGDQRGVARRRGLAAAWAAFLFLAGLAALDPSPAGAQTRPADLPPPPGALQRELGLTSSAPAAAIAPGSSVSLSNPIEIPFVAEAGHIIVEASIDGTAPKPFMFDTGARNAITPEMARTLNAAVVGTERTAGIGPKISRVDKIKVDRIAIGAATLDQQTIRILDMPNIIVDRGSRPRLAGLIGSELLARYAVTIDFGRRLLILNSPGYRPKAAAFSLPLGLIMLPDGLSHPSIAAELDGVAGDFMIDTGASGEILLSEKFQQEHRPFAEIGPILRFLSPGGIGGHVNVQMGFGKRLRIGPSALSPPLISGVVEIRGSGLGYGMASQISGVIGAAVLAQFIITIDYQSLRAFFEPVASRSLTIALCGAGMILDKPDHEMFEILDVLKGTAADRAGLRRGDRIVEIAGRPARDLGYADFVALNSTPAHGSMTVETSDQRRIDLAIGRLLP